MAKDSLYVTDKDQKIPFLRGMMTHSLIERGLGFKDAYDTANQVRDRLRDRGTISKNKLGQLVASILEERYGSKYAKKPAVPQIPMILVRGEETMPFSKGILSQSLQASGLEPSVSYSIAQEIEQLLVGKKQQEIQRVELRRLIYKTILKKHDAAFAKRYLIWRYFKAPDKPVVILFGGATGTGKTSVATEVGHRLGIQKVLSTDTIRQIMRMMFSRDLLPAIHYSSYEAWKEFVPAGAKPGEAVLSAFKEQTTRVLVGVRAMVDRAISENTSMLIDGVHLVPGLMEFEKVESKAYIIPVVISTLNIANYLERFPARQNQSTNRSAQQYRKNFDSILQIQNYILEMAENNGCPIIENNILEETVSSILTVITNSLQEKLAIPSEELLAKAL